MSTTRKRRGSTNNAEESVDKKRRPTSAIMGISRSIAACKRCRVRKVKCDQKFPSCSRCVTANEPCVSVDPATGRDVPRSYVIFLEDRLEALTKRLREYGVDAAEVQGNIPATSDDCPCDVNVFEEKIRAEHQVPRDNAMAGYIINNGTSIQAGVASRDQADIKTVSELQESAKSLDSLGAMKISKKNGKLSLGAASNSYLGDSSGIPFAKLILTAINFAPDAVEETSEEPVSTTDAREEPLNVTYLPTKEEAEALVSQYFTYCNSQLPILHREYFLKRVFEPIYGPLDEGVSLSSDNTIINGNFKLPQDKSGSEQTEEIWYKPSLSQQEEKHSEEIPPKYQIPLFFLNMVLAIGDSARILETDETKSVAFKDRASEFKDALFRSNDRMEALAGTLLIAKYSIMRPNVPGVWYTMGSALRLAVDLGLHAEKLNKNYDPFTRDLRRRLFWCTYSLDRQICAFFGRPFGIPDDNISTEFPSSLDDALITYTADNIEDYSLVKSSMASYKCISLAFFRIRKIQAQIVQELYAHRTSLPDGFESLDEWRELMNEELDEWYEKRVPKTHRKMNCHFPTELFELELCHSKVMLYGLCPKAMTLDERGYEVVYENTKKVIEMYYRLCHDGNIMHTWVTVHNLFMAGMTFLYVLHNARFDPHESLQKSQKTCSTLIYVLEQLTKECEAARKGARIFKVLSAAVLKLRSEQGEGSPGADGNDSDGGGGGGGESEDGSDASDNEHPLDGEAYGGHTVEPGRNQEGLELELDEEARMSRLGTTAHGLSVPDLDAGALNQFFVELDKLSPFSDLSNGPATGPRELHLDAGHASVGANVTIRPSDEHSGPSEPAALQPRPLASSRDGQRVFDMMNQFSTETIWDQVFSK
ncbi:LAQU0S11e01112g1_1 [Lachancea quebecensis]|uniref:LAQU0S11e01112g1_1 n=1 Tax=Lachancea quebecensis TaxID=1654605 RepID=A0A0P1KU95_9SACH|nr:LAQU0S11e01112g1_1 [Lachancea quebecensis]